MDDGDGGMRMIRITGKGIVTGSFSFIFSAEHDWYGTVHFTGLRGSCKTSNLGR
jgi:hypothetical protein